MNVWNARMQVCLVGLFFTTYFLPTFLTKIKERNQYSFSWQHSLISIAYFFFTWDIE